MKKLCCINVIFTILINVANSAPQQSLEINDQFDNSSNKDADVKAVQHLDTNNQEPNAKEAEPRETQHVDMNTIPEITNPPETKDATESDRIVINDQSDPNNTATQNTSVSIVTRFITTLKKPFLDFIETPKVNMVLRNIGTCIVNGAMEIVTFYFPAPLIPLIASAAGMVIPFEPIVMLRKRMPVTSYRRAFQTAVNSFMGTFDRFKASEEVDPYMSRSFNRRFIGTN